MPPRRQSGMRYGPDLFGKHIFRVRESHVRDHIAPLLSTNGLGAARVDLLLRGLALSPAHLGNRTTPGLVVGRPGYDELHDVVRPAGYYDPDEPFDDDEGDAKVRRLKRKWFGSQLRKLENLDLLERVERPGSRPDLTVLRDDGTGAPYDDPDGKDGASYVTILGGIFATGAIREWSAPELVAYLAAMIAERFESARMRRHDLKVPPVGAGEWFRPLWWFADPDRRRPDANVRVPFAVATLERGIARHVANGLIARRQERRDPLTGRRFRTGPRNVYSNRFAALNEAAGIDLSRLDDQLGALVRTSRS